MSDLDAVFDKDGNPAAPPPTEPVENPPESQQASPDTPPEGSEQPQDTQTMPVSAHVTERKKWQQKNRELEEENLRLQGYQQAVQQFGFQQGQQPQQQVDPQDAYNENPVGFVQNQLHQQTLRTSVMLARHRYEDYDEMEKVFHDAAQANPVLVQHMYASGDPAEFAYREAKRLSEKPQDFEQRLAAEKAKWEAEQKAKAGIPPTTNAGGRSLAPGGGGQPSYVEDPLSFLGPQE